MYGFAYGLQLCAQRNIKNIVVEIDLFTLVQLLKHESVVRSSMCHQLRRIRSYMDSLLASISHVFRVSNSAVDYLATSEQHQDFVILSSNCHPLRLREIGNSDRLGVPYIRTRFVRE